MLSSVSSQQPTQTIPTVGQDLQNVLADTYSLYLMTHNYHWNVEGQNFLPFHTLFEAQYNELFHAIDVIAERIRAVGEYALPFDSDKIIQISKMASNPLNKDINATARASRMVDNLIAMNMAVIRSCQAVKEAARTIHDDETENLMVERITAHQKALWFLSSTTKWDQE